MRSPSCFFPAAAFLLIIAGANYDYSCRSTHHSNKAVSREEELKRLAGVLNGATAVLASTVTSYWYAARFGASPQGMIGVAMSASYLLAAILSWLTGRPMNRSRTMIAILGLQSCAIMLLLKILPWVTSFGPAAWIEIGCTACSLGTRGNSTAVMMEDRSADWPKSDRPAEPALHSAGCRTLAWLLRNLYR